MSKIEEVARALYAADGMKHAAANVSLEESWDRSPGHHRRYLDLARAALRAIREPDEGMVNRMAKDMINEYWGEDCWDALIEEDFDHWLDVARKGHTAAIDHALTQETSE